MRAPAPRPTHHASRFNLLGRASVPASPNFSGNPTNQGSRGPSASPEERGVALVITLILLSVITFMAITFLVVSRSEKSSVSTQTDMHMARLAADTARDRAIAEIMNLILTNSVLTNNNPFNYGLLVSTNYINTNGFDPTPGALDSLTNVNYDYTTAGSPLNLPQQLQNIQNLWWNPRPPVVIVTNLNPAPNTASNDFRFYVDLNQNGMFDPTGYLPLTNNLNQPTGFWDYLVGDPQWIGLLQHAELFHSPTNLFTSRYAYLVVPAGQTLDLNMVHNYGKPGITASPNGTWSDAFLRNQGVMTAEMNLAGFFVDLNTNYWPFPVGNAFGAPYTYYADQTTPNSGAAFQDAVALLRYRYAANIKSLATAGNLFGAPGNNAFSRDFMDGYCGGPLMTNTWWPTGTIDQDTSRTKNPWPGAENPNHFYSSQDLFDPNKAAQPGLGKGYTLPQRLKMAGTNVDTYDRYTFYRLLSQLGTDSAPEPTDKMNLNYCNVDKFGYVVPGATTNFQSWNPAQFFTNAAIRLMVDAGYTVGASYSTSNLLVTNVISGVLVTNLQIPIWPTNYYTPSLHRLFQLAANLYDATTNRLDASYPQTYPYLPTVFQPLFTPVGKNGIFIRGYQEVLPSDTFTTILTTKPPLDLSDPTDRSNLRFNSMVYNVPLVIGAKKGMPSFNELAMDTQVQAARKLIYKRPNGSTTAPVNEMDPAYYVSVTNVVGLQAWNSYAAAYNRPVQLYAWPDTSVILTNENGVLLNPPAYGSRQPLNSPPNAYTAIWPGYNVQFPGSSFITPLGAFPSNTASYVFVPTNSVYSLKQQIFVLNGNYDSTPNFTNYHIPQFMLTLKARMRFALVDQNSRRLLDYVHISTSLTTNLMTVLGGSACGPNYSQVFTRDALWCTNLPTTIHAGTDPYQPFGIRLQNDISSGTPKLSTTEWKSSMQDPIYGADEDKGIARFLYQFTGLGQAGPGAPAFVNLSTFAAPYSPLRTIHIPTVWMANDPLVHYTLGDVQDPADYQQPVYLDETVPTIPPTHYGTPAKRYEPWGKPNIVGRFDSRFKDPVAANVGNSDAWDFPTNKFPNPGWLGRVHRGTPWQTVYLKSTPLPLTGDLRLPGIWTNWTGNTMTVTNYGQFATNMPQWIAGAVGNGVGAVQFVTTNQWAFDAFSTEPTNDWRLVDLFSTAFDANATRGRLSINQTNLAAWSSVLSGVLALTNTGVDGNGNGLVSPWVIPPAGYYDPTLPASNSWPAIARIVNGINRARANTNNALPPVFPNQVFHRLGDILAVPELTMASPFLSPNPVPTPFNDNFPPNPPLSDAAVERLPQQILGLLKCDQTPRVVIYSYGQALKPANHSKMTSGPFFGLVTNYQITAEVATRSVVRFDGVPPYLYGAVPAITNLHPVIESFTVLPPD
ncbi:MAG TPA: hypothetical protein VMU04_05615 [Candidatus Acidoferrum sp.]|nr:hypothetical protein [Candidatus Acidoferrum sp.]